MSHSGRTVATLSHDLTVRLWDVDGETPRQTLLGHKEHPLVACFSPDDRLLATMERTGTIYLWHVKTGQLMLTLDEFPVERAFDLRFRDDQTLFAVGQRQLQPSICVWRVGPADGGR